MLIVINCPCCHKTFKSDVAIPADAKQERQGIINYLVEHPMGIGGGALDSGQLRALLEGVLVK